MDAICSPYMWKTRRITDKPSFFRHNQRGPIQQGPLLHSMLLHFSIRFVKPFTYSA